MPNQRNESDTIEVSDPRTEGAICSLDSMRDCGTPVCVAAVSLDRRRALSLIAALQERINAADPVVVVDDNYLQV